jgi:membrane fusion protein, multidrug efflux system
MNFPRFFHKKDILALLGLSVSIWWFTGSATDKKPAPPPALVAVAQVMRSNVPIQVPLVGTVVAHETVAIKSRLDSQIMDVRFKDGDLVSEGQVLFVLDDRAINAQIAQFQAAVIKDKAQLVNFHSQYQRMLKLFKTQVVSQAQVDDAKAAYEAQVAQVNSAQANLNNAKVQLSYTLITAPISGRTGTINSTRGNNVKANDPLPLVTINQIRPIRVQCSIPQRYYEDIKTALSAGDVLASASHKESVITVQGRLEYLDNAVDVSNGTFAARALFANEDEKLWPGMFVNITLDLGLEKNVLTIPSIALQGDEGKHFVFVFDGETKKAVRKSIEISRIVGEKVIVTTGLSETDQVIFDGLLRVSDGAVVEVKTNP